MKYKKYPSYKDSGVEWLGEIPEHWLKLSLKQLVEIKDGTHDTPKYVEPSDKSFPLVTSKDTTSGEISFSKTKHISEADYISINRRSNVEKGDIIMPMIGSVGSPVLVDTTKAFSIKNVALFKTSRSNIFASYLCYYMDSHAINIQFALESRGGVQDFVSLGLLQNVFAFKIPLLEQQQIAKFLDNATQKMDTLIQKQENLIKLLKEKRQAVISHAVTRGLNPDVKFKDSGVEWLGEVPEHWSMSKLKYDSYIKARVGWHGLTSDELFEDGDAYAVTGSDFLGNVINWKDCRKCTLERYKQDRFIQLKDNDLLVTKDGTIGKIIKVNKLPNIATLNGGIFVLRPLHEKYNTSYYYWLLISSVFHGFVSYYKTGSTISHLYQDTFCQMPYPLPCLDEQKEISIYLDDKTKKIDKLIKKATKSIKLLKEKRTALISAAVTGKIDVRELV